MYQYDSKEKVQSEKSKTNTSTVNKSDVHTGTKMPVQTKSLFSPSFNAEKLKSNYTSRQSQLVPISYSPLQKQLMSKQDSKEPQPLPMKLSEEQEQLATTFLKPNNTGIPLQMKEKYENLSGFSFDDVRVHYNSGKPAQLQALAYTQGNQVYVAPGQEKHLGHELGHVVQQKQGIVRPNLRINESAVNDSPELEYQADQISHQSTLIHTSQLDLKGSAVPGTLVAQRVPNLADVAIHRLLRLLNVPLAQFDHRMNQLIIQHQANPQQASHIRALGLPNNLIARLLVLPGRISYLNAIRDYYDSTVAGNAAHGVQVNMGTDVERIDPRNTRNARRQILLPILQTSLRRILLQGARSLIRTAIAHGDSVNPGVQPAQDQFTPLPQAPNKNGQTVAGITWGTDSDRARADRAEILAGAAQFDAMVDPRILQRDTQIQGDALPNVTIDDTPVGMVTSPNSRMGYGLGSGRSQVVHEFGHHLEMNLNVNDMVMVHNFLRARTRQGPTGVMRSALNMFGLTPIKQTPSGDRTAAWNLFGRYPIHVKGYSAELPPMKFQNLFSRIPPLSSGNSLGKFVMSNIGNAALEKGMSYGARALRHVPLLSRVIPSQQAVDKRARRFVDDFFLQDSNSESTSYATAYEDRDGTNRFSTEFISTTAELLSTVRGATELISADPLRAALFLYLANRKVYNRVNQSFQQIQQNQILQNPQQAPVEDLDTMIHVIT